MAVNVSNGVHGEIAEICFDHNQIKVLTNWVVELLSRVKTNVRLLPTIGYVRLLYAILTLLLVLLFTIYMSQSILMKQKTF